MAMSQASTRGCSPQGAPSPKIAVDVVLCNPDFHRVARSRLQSLNRGWSTPDPGDADGELVPRSIPSIKRGWQTPDPMPTYTAKVCAQPRGATKMQPRSGLTAEQVREAAERAQIARDKEVAESDVQLSRKSLYAASSPHTASLLDTEDTMPLFTASNSPSICTSAMDWKSPEGLLIFVDFDDTIFPTSWIVEKAGFKKWMAGKCEPGDILEPGDTERLQRLEQAARAVVLGASQLGKVQCVTLARRCWPVTVMQAFMPNLARTMNELGIDIHYAQERKPESRRARDEMGPPTWCVASNFIDDSQCNVLRAHLAAAMKQKVMSRLLRRFYGPRGSWKNVLSFGDGPAEQMALQEIGFQHENPVCPKTGVKKSFRVKTVKMLEVPDCDQLTEELHLIHAWLPALASLDADIDISFGDSEEDMWDTHQLLREVLEPGPPTAA